MRLRLSTGAVIAAAALAAAACGDGSSSSASPSTSSGAAASSCPSGGSVTASGSTALQPLVEQAAQAYKLKCPGVTVSVSGGGSSTGLANVASGTSDIGSSDVPVSNAANVDPSTVKDNEVAIVIFAVAVNALTGVTNLRKDQIHDLFVGRVTNWSQVGGASLPVSLIERKTGSGTRLSFDKIFLQRGEQESGSPASTQDSTQLVLQQVAGNPDGVSYLGASSIKGGGVSGISIDGAAPTAENVRGGSYHYFSHEHMYTRAAASDVARAFIGYILSDEFQAKLTGLGYVPVSTTSRQSDADR